MSNLSDSMRNWDEITTIVTVACEDLAELHKNN